jgi:addiction module RelE/StbE family toxin
VKLVWSPLAFSDREAIFGHIEEESPRSAAAVDMRIEEAVRRLVDFPQSGRPGRVDGTRELVVPRTSFVAAYVVTADSVRIPRVLHGAQRWPEEWPSSRPTP